MPLLNSDYRAPWWLPGGHIQTLFPVIFRAPSIVGRRVDIVLPDQDRLSAELYDEPLNETRRLVILTHGLEGSSQQSYILGMTKAALNIGFHVLAWNLRGCGAVDNLLPKLYNSGSSEDLDAVIRWAVQQGYREVYLAGYSLGGNVTLKWLGEQGAQAAVLGVKAACVASVPVDLANCVDTLDRWDNWIYRQHFLRDMKRRLRAKAKKFPGTIDLSRINSVRTMRDYDDTYVGPLNGYGNAQAYHAACSSKKFLSAICVPSLLINSRNDPFFGEPCLPCEIAEKHNFLTLEITGEGGHVGYFSHRLEWWLEQRFLNFFTQLGSSCCESLNVVG